MQGLHWLQAVTHAPIQEFLPEGGLWEGGQDRLPENSSDKVFFCCFLVLSLFYSFKVVYLWFISKKTIIFQGFREGPTFSRGDRLFPGGGGGGGF